jgi:phage terminase large subunit GpA-like protein
MDAISDPLTQEVVVMSSAQVGKTEMINNTVGYFIDQDPAPVLVLQPTIEMSEAWSKDRLAPMLRDTRCLQGKVADPRARDSGNTVRHKTFPGGHITMAGANAPASLASRPIRIVLADEIDRYPASAGTEGDPLSLAVKRTTTFHNRKVIITSTPTVKGFSRIEMAFNETDQRHYHILCPHCQHPHVLRWGNVIWTKDEPENAHFVCPSCSAPYTDVQKDVAVRRAESQGGGWIASAPFKGKAGFHLNELYSPWRRLKETVAEFLVSKPFPERLQVWINTALGETWDAGGEILDENELLTRRERYAAEVPSRALYLTIGADTQPDRIEAEVVGWGSGEETWSVDYQVFHGDPDIPEGQPGSPWSMFADYTRKRWKHESGVELAVSMTCIDTGGSNTQAVYDFVKAHKGHRIFGIKGFSGENLPIVGAPNRKRSGRKQKKIDLYPVGVDQAKSVVVKRLRIAEPGPGYCHFPEGRDIDYFRQLTAEKMVTKYVKGFPKREWHKQEGRRNEALDCRVYAFAAFVMSPPQMDKIAFRIKTEVAERGFKPEAPKPVVISTSEATAQDPEAPIGENATNKPKPRRVRRGSFINQWRT